MTITLNYNNYNVIISVIIAPGKVKSIE